MYTNSYMCLYIFVHIQYISDKARVCACVCVLTLLCTIRLVGDLSVWPSGGDGAGGRADGGERQHDLRGIQASVWSDQWEHWRCLSATSCRRQQGEAHHAHAHTPATWFSQARPPPLPLLSCDICWSWTDLRAATGSVGCFIYLLITTLLRWINSLIHSHRLGRRGRRNDRAGWRMNSCSNKQF